MSASVNGNDPFDLFRTWYDAAETAGVVLPDAMVLATATPDGAPSARVILYKGLNQDGFRFVTNYCSRKAAELDANPKAALVFWWRELGRQVRIEGQVAKVPKEESDAYFAGRSRGRSIGAWASKQSAVIQDPEEIRTRVRQFEARFPDTVPRPENWGGYRLTPHTIEFWEEGEDRLHRRRRFRKRDTQWIMDYLAP